MYLRQGRAQAIISKLINNPAGKHIWPANHNFMKKILFAVILGVGLITLSACTKVDQEKPENVQVPPAAVADQNAAVATVPVAITSPIADGNYSIDSAASRVAWKASKVIATHTGLVTVKSGSIDIAQGKLSGGEVTIDMASISSDENISGLVKHLSGPDFFDVTAYPEAKLKITTIAPGTDANSYVISGDLTIKGVTIPVTFSASSLATTTGLEIKTDFNIDRTKWGLKYGSGQFFKDLGNKTIADEISFSIDIQAKQ